MKVKPWWWAHIFPLWPGSLYYSLAEVNACRWEATALLLAKLQQLGLHLTTQTLHQIPVILGFLIRMRVCRGRSLGFFVSSPAVRAQWSGGAQAEAFWKAFCRATEDASIFVLFFNPNVVWMLQPYRGQESKGTTYQPDHLPLGQRARVIKGCSLCMVAWKEKRE